MPDEEQLAPAAEAPAEEPETPAAPTADEIKAERDQRAAEGRAKAREYERRAEAAEKELQVLRTQTQHLAQQLQNVNGYLTAQQQQAWEARVAALPPEQQAVERSRLAEYRANLAYQQAIQAQQRPPTPPTPAPSPETPEQYAERRAREMLTEANEYYGLRGRDALTVEDLEAFAREREVDPWASEKKFNGLVYEAASARTRPGRAPEEREMAKSKPDDAYEKRVQAEVEKRLRAETGAHRSLAAEPVGPAVEVGSDEVRARYNDPNYRSNYRGMAGRNKENAEFREQVRQRAREALRTAR